jgi:hypothetical protein
MNPPSPSQEGTFLPLMFGRYIRCGKACLLQYRIKPPLPLLIQGGELSYYRWKGIGAVATYFTLQ